PATFSSESVASVTTTSAADIWIPQGPAAKRLGIVLHRVMIRAVLLIVLAVLPAAAGAQDGTMTYHLRNFLPHPVVIELQSQTRRHVWPGDNKVYFLEEGERKAVPIDCQAGERICYAAWVDGNGHLSWGVGPDGTQACVDCCAICVPKGTAIVEIEE